MPIIRLPKGELRDEVRYPLIDGRELADGADPSGVYDFFASVQGKARYLTNLQQNSLLPQGNSFRVMGLSFNAQNSNPARRNLLTWLQEKSAIEFWVGEKKYFDSPLLFVAGRLEQNYAVAGGTGTVAAIERVHQKFGTAIAAPVLFSGKHTVDIAPLQQFYIRHTTNGLTAQQIAELVAAPAAGLSTIIYATLSGLLRRPVQ